MVAVLSRNKQSLRNPGPLDQSIFMRLVIGRHTPAQMMQVLNYPPPPPTFGEE